MSRLGRVAGITSPLPPRRFLRRAKYQRLQRRLAGPKLLHAFAENYPDPFFIEIGSNDGEQHDHLQPFILAHAWRGVMIEPVPYIFERLQRNYRELSGVALQNVAIADRDGERAFYYLRKPSPEEVEHLPSWYDGVGSFSREAVLAHAREIPDVEDRLVEASIRCLTLTSLCDGLGVEHFDLLLIDTEGYDWEILRSIAFDRYRPRLLIYEHYHLPSADRAECRRHLEALGYATMEEGFDTFCLQQRPEDNLSETWRMLTPAVPGVSADQLDP